MPSERSIRKLAEMVESVQGIDNISIEKHDVKEVPDANMTLAQLFGGEELETREVMVIICGHEDETPEQEIPEKPERPDGYPTL